MGQKHKPFREFRTPFPLRDIRENPRSNVRACAAGDGAICSKNRKIVPYHGANPNTRNGARLRSPSPIMAPAKNSIHNRSQATADNHFTINPYHKIMAKAFRRRRTASGSVLIFNIQRYELITTWNGYVWQRRFAFGDRFPIFKVHTTSHPLVCTKTNLKPRDLTHLGRISLLRLRCRTSTEGKKKQTYWITSKATQKRRGESSCVDCSEHVSLFSRQI